MFQQNIRSRGSPQTSRRWLSLPAAVLLILTAASAHAATYYVATNGSDSNPGSEAAPFKRINFAYSKVGAGDTIIVKPGVYTETIGGGYCFRFNKDGTQSAPITIKSERVWGAVLDGKNDESLCHKVVTMSGDYNTLEGFEITNAAYEGLAAVANYIRVISNNIHHNGTKTKALAPPYPVSSGIIGEQSTKGDQFIGNYIHHNGREFTHDQFAQNLDHGMYLGGDDMLIVNNIVAYNRDIGLHLKGGAVVQNARIYNNVFAYNGRAGLLFWKTFNGVAVHNNIFYSNGKGYAIDSYDAHGGGVDFAHNIFFGHSKGNMLTNGSGSDFAFTTDANSTSDPLFVNAIGGDFGLQASSPAIDKGVTTGIPYDFTGKARPEGAAYDIGAFEGAGSKANVLPGVGAGLPPSGSGAPVLLGPNGEVCPTGYLPL